MKDIYDVVVVGAGPAGATAAYYIAKQGHRVLLLDKKSFPREKVCGDGLMPDSLRCLEQMGLLSKVKERGHPMDSAAIYSPSGIKCEIKGNFITIKRSALDALIVEHAINTGVFLKTSEAGDLFPLSDSIVLKTTTGEIIKAKVCILATGARVKLAKKVGITTSTRPSAIAVRCYVQSSLDINELILSFDHSILPGYAWIFPMGNQEFNVGYGIFSNKRSPEIHNLLASFGIFLKNFPLASELLKSGKIISTISGAMLRCGLTDNRSVTIGNILAVGETIGTTFPFTGEGIGKAMESAVIAADLVNKFLASGDRSFLISYGMHLNFMLKPKYRGYKIAEKWLTRSWTGDFIATRSKKSKFMRKSLNGIINETVDPRTIFSFSGLLRSIFS